MIASDTEKMGRMFEDVEYWYSGGRYTWNGTRWVEGDVIADPGNPFHGESVGDTLVELSTHNISSYLAWIANASTDSIDAAFGKGNEEFITNIGVQLAMFAWFKGTDRTLYPFSNLITCNTLTDIRKNPLALAELKGNSYLIAFIKSNAYAYEKMTSNYSISFADKTLNDLVLYTTSLSTIKLTDGILQITGNTGTARVTERNVVPMDQGDTIFIHVTSSTKPGGTGQTIYVGAEGATASIGSVTNYIAVVPLTSVVGDIKFYAQAVSGSGGNPSIVNISRYWIGNDL